MTRDTNLTMRSHLRLLWRRKWLLAVPVVLATATAYGLALQQPATYASHADLMYERPSAAGGAPVDVRTEARVATSPGVAASAAEDLGGGTTAADVAAAVTAAPVDNLPLLRVTAQAGSADRAQQLVESTVDAYRAARQERVDQQRTAAIDEASGRIDELTRELDQVTRELATSGGASSSAPPTDGVVVARRDLLVSQLAVQQSRLDELRSDAVGTLDDVSVLVPATRSERPVAPQPIRSGAIGLVIGLLVGFALVLGREQFDDRTHSLGGIEDALVAPTLAVVPARRGRWRKRDSLAVTTAPHSPAAEAYRILRANLAATGVGSQHRVLLVTSALPGEGKSTTAANLALAFTEAHTRVVLVDADLRRPRLHELLEVPNRLGLSDALAATPNYGGLTGVETPVGRLGLLPAGTVGDGPGATLSRPGLAAVLDKLQDGRLVIVDAPPMLPVADAALLADHADAIVVAVDPTRSDRRTLEHLRARVAATGTPLLGFVLHAAKGELTTDAYGYGYGADAYLRDTPPPQPTTTPTRRRRRRSRAVSS